MHVPFIWRSIRHSSIATVMAAPRTASILVALSAATISASAIASEYYVATDGVDAAGRGSEASPFHTIQYAIDQAAAGDTIWVKPGIYDQGGAQNTGSDGIKHTNRVVLTKKIHLKSTDGASATHIVGAPDPSTGSFGQNAVRCIVSPDDNSLDSTISGFTLRDGYGGRDGYHSGGGFLQRYGNARIYISDCVISNCAATAHGGARGGTFARCLFTGNRCNHATSDGQHASAVGSAKLIHCVIVGNGDSDESSARDWAVSQATLVNCTVVCNRGRSGPNNSNVKNTCYNTVFCGHGYSDQQDANTYNNCTTAGYPVFSPLANDWRVVAGSAADSTGDTSRLTSVPFTVIAGMAGKDFAGNNIDLTAAHVHAGAVQETVSTDGGVLRLVGPLSWNGITVPDGMPTYLQTTNLLTQYRVEFSRSRTSGSSTTYLRTIRRRSGNETFLTPAFDDSLMMMVPPKAGISSTSDPIYCKAVWVNPLTGNDASHDGSEAAPFATIQKAVDAGGNDTVIYLAPGVYGQGGVVSADQEVAPYVNTRVWITNSNVRIVGVAGPEQTIISGAPDSGTGGLGDGAWRCVGGNKSWIVVSGVTLSNGWTRAVSTERDSAGNGAAAFGVNNIFLTDCIVTDCHAYGDVLHRTAAYRCLVSGNIAERESLFSGEWGRLVCTWVGSNTTRSSDYFGYVGQNCEAWFSTLVVPDGRSAFAKTALGIYNCIAVGGSAVRSSMVSKGNIFWNFTTVDDGAAGTFANPRLWTDKMHVKDDSPAITAGIAPSEAGYDAGDPISSIWVLYCSADVEGNPLLFNAGGTVLAGAVHTLFPSQLPTTVIVR